MDSFYLYGVREMDNGDYELFNKSFGAWVSKTEARKSMKELYNAVKVITPEEMETLETIEI